MSTTFWLTSWINFSISFFRISCIIIFQIASVLAIDYEEDPLYIEHKKDEDIIDWENATSHLSPAASNAKSNVNPRAESNTTPSSNGRTESHSEGPPGFTAPPPFMNKEERNVGSADSNPPSPPTYQFPRGASPYDTSSKPYAYSGLGQLYSEGKPYGYASVIQTYISKNVNQAYSQHCNRPFKTTPRIRIADLSMAFEFAAQSAIKYIANEKKDKKLGLYLNRTASIDARIQLSNLVLKETTQFEKGIEALRMEYASRYLAERY